MPTTALTSAPTAVLYQHDEPVYALLDAAREARIPGLLEASGERYASLYVGTEANDLASVAPYLVLLPKASNLGILLAEEGWGRSWGVYLQSGAGLEATRQHLRAQLMAQTASGSPLYFRYYDPRVLRAFLKVSNRAEVAELFGPITSFVLEAEDPSVALRYTVGPDGVREERAQLKKS